MDMDAEVGELKSSDSESVDLKSLAGAIPSKNQWFASKEARTEGFSGGIETARVGANGTEAYGTLTAQCDL